MAKTFDDITSGQRLTGVTADGEVSVVALDRHGDTSATLAYRTADGRLDERILTLGDLATIEAVSQRRWTFDADPQAFRLASKARRMKCAYLALTIHGGY